MKFVLSTIATAALAMVASSAAIEKALPLPARFGMYLETAEPSINGLRIKYAGGMVIGHNQPRSVKDAVFLGGDGRISLDLSVHTNPSGQTPHTPYGGGAWNIMILGDEDTISVTSEEFQAVIKSWGPDYIPIVSTFVQTTDHKLRLVDSKGGLINRIQVCGSATTYYEFWWDGAEYLECTPVELRIEEL